MNGGGWGEKVKVEGVLHRPFTLHSISLHSISPLPRQRATVDPITSILPPSIYPPVHHSRFVKPYPSSSQLGGRSSISVCRWGVSQGRGRDSGAAGERRELIAHFLQPSSEDPYSVSPSHLFDSTPPLPTPLTGLGGLHPLLQPLSSHLFDFGERSVRHV